MKVLITGSGGFLGGHLKHFLEQQQARVYTLGTRDLGSNHFKLEGVGDRMTMRRALEEVEPDYLFHLAGVSISDDWSLLYSVNCSFAVSLLSELCRLGKNIPMLLTGSASEYGFPNPSELPLKESMRPLPHTHYGVSKYAQTLAALATFRIYPAIVVARPFNIIGPGMGKHLVVQDFLAQLAANATTPKQAVLKVGDLQASRDFIDVRDAIEIYWRLIRSEAAYGGVFNVCSGKATAIGDICESLIKLSGLSVTIEREDARINPNQPRHTYGDNSMTTAMIGYTASISLEDSLAWIVNSQPFKTISK